MDTGDKSDGLRLKLQGLQSEMQGLKRLAQAGGYSVTEEPGYAELQQRIKQIKMNLGK